MMGLVIAHQKRSHPPLRRADLADSLAYGLDAVETGLQISGTGASRSELSTHLAQLFLIHERPAHRHDIVLGFEFDDGAFGGGGLSTQRLKPLLQPAACAPICLELGIQLVKDVCINHCIRDFGGLLRITRAKINIYHIALTDAADIKSAHQGTDRLANTLCF